MMRLFKCTFLCFLLVGELSASNEGVDKRLASTYDKSIQNYLKPYLLPANHRMKQVLDRIFAQSRPLTDPDSFEQAGFKTLLVKRAAHMGSGYWRLAKHPLVPGYLFKIYLNSEKLEKYEGCLSLGARCEGAANIRTLIKRKNLRHMVVPDKWLYKVPRDPTIQGAQEEVILMVTDMNIVSNSETKEAWKRANKDQINELHCILSHGFASTFLIGNICYTRNGKFACLDTEVPKRKHKLSKVKRYLSPDMIPYWNQLSGR